MMQQMRWQNPSLQAGELIKKPLFHAGEVCSALLLDVLAGFGRHMFNTLKAQGKGPSQSALKGLRDFSPPSALRPLSGLEALLEPLQVQGRLEVEATLGIRSLPVVFSNLCGDIEARAPKDSPSLPASGHQGSSVLKNPKPRCLPALPCTARLVAWRAFHVALCLRVRQQNDVPGSTRQLH